MVYTRVWQFIDIGSGLPTQGDVHQLVQQYAPDHCRVIYIDHDPVATAHAYLLLERADKLARNRPMNGDVLAYDALWDAIGDTELIDLETGRTQPRGSARLLRRPGLGGPGDRVDPGVDATWTRPARRR